MKKVFWSISLVLALCFLTVCVLSSCSSEGAGTKELRYTYLEESDSYEVSGIRDDELKKVVIPSKYDGKPVTSIGNGAFEDCDLLVEITIPDSVTNIGAGAFSGCLDLAKIKLPDSLTHIGYTFTDTAWYKDSRNWEDGILYHGKYLIAAKEELESCSIKEGTVLIADGAFISVRLASIVIPEGVERIGQGAFTSTYIEEITIPSSVTYIGLDAFAFVFSDNLRVHIKSLDSWLAIDFENSASNPLWLSRERGNRELYLDGEAVTEITVPVSVSKIGESAFWGCKTLSQITVPKSVIRIEESSFYHCENLSVIIYEGTVAEWNAIEKGDYCFEGINESARVICTDGEVEL